MTHDYAMEQTSEQFERVNNIEEITSSDEIYAYDANFQESILESRLWLQNPNYFKRCKISAIALLKLLMHAHSSGSSDVMGMLLGKVEIETIIIMDSFALPSENSGIHMNTQKVSYEYINSYQLLAKEVNRPEYLIGWYHSHPGYHCYLGTTDINTQMQYQQHSDPSVVIIVDPIRSISTSEVNIEAFRTYPKGHQPKIENEVKIGDFHIYNKRYYELEISFFKSSLHKYIIEDLWNQFWIRTLNASTLLTNANYITDRINDVANKLEQVESHLDRTNSIPLPRSLNPIPEPIGSCRIRSADKIRSDSWLRSH